MGRPQRVREAEEGRAAEITQTFNAANPVKDDDEALESLSLDTSGERGHESAVGEADDWAIPIAKRLGYVTREEWTGDPAKHEDVRTFLNRTPDAFEAQADRLRRYSQSAQALAEEARQQGIREAEQRLLQAHRSGDEEGVKQAASQIAGQQRHPQTDAWMQKNPWFWTEPDAQAVAAAAMERARRTGAGVDEQLAAADAVIAKRFPELTGAPVISPSPTREEPTLARAPLVQGGSRAVTVRASAEKGWADMPVADRRTYERGFLRQMTRMGMTEDEARKKLARSYWGVGTQGAPA